MTMSSAADDRIAQHRRVMEILQSKDDSEVYKALDSSGKEMVDNLFPMLEHYDYTKNDIARLVKKMKFDVTAVQRAVEHILDTEKPGAASGISTEWNTVVSKQEKRRLQEEERKKLEEEERLRRKEEARKKKEEEKARRKAEKKAWEEEQERERVARKEEKKKRKEREAKEWEEWEEERRRKKQEKKEKREKEWVWDYAKNEWRRWTEADEPKRLKDLLGDQDSHVVLSSAAVSKESPDRPQQRQPSPSSKPDHPGTKDHAKGGGKSKSAKDRDWDIDHYPRGGVGGKEQPVDLVAGTTSERGPSGGKDKDSHKNAQTTGKEQMLKGDVASPGGRKGGESGRHIDYAALSTGPSPAKQESKPVENLSWYEATAREQQVDYGATPGLEYQEPPRKGGKKADRRTGSPPGGKKGKDPLWENSPNQGNETAKFTDGRHINSAVEQQMQPGAPPQTTGAAPPRTVAERRDYTLNSTNLAANTLNALYNDNAQRFQGVGGGGASGGGAGAPAALLKGAGGGPSSFASQSGDRPRPTADPRGVIDSHTGEREGGAAGGGYHESNSGSYHGKGGGKGPGKGAGGYDRFAPERRMGGGMGGPHAARDRSDHSRDHAEMNHKGLQQPRKDYTAQRRNSQTGRDDRDRDDAEKKRAEENPGKHLVCKKHSSIGCALITFRNEKHRDLVMRAVQKGAGMGSDEILRKGVYAQIAGLSMSVKPRTDKAAGDLDVPTDIFVGWGRQTEMKNPISGEALVEHFDALVEQLDPAAAQALPVVANTTPAVGPGGSASTANNFAAGGAAPGVGGPLGNNGTMSGNAAAVGGGVTPGADRPMQTPHQGVQQGHHAQQMHMTPQQVTPMGAPQHAQQHLINSSASGGPPQHQQMQPPSQAPPHGGNTTNGTGGPTQQQQFAHQAPGQQRQHHPQHPNMQQQFVQGQHQPHQQSQVHQQQHPQAQHPSMMQHQQQQQQQGPPPQAQPQQAQQHPHQQHQGQNNMMQPTPTSTVGGISILSHLQQPPAHQQNQHQYQPSPAAQQGPPGGQQQGGGGAPGGYNGVVPPPQQQQGAPMYAQGAPQGSHHPGQYGGPGGGAPNMRQSGAPAPPMQGGAGGGYPQQYQHPGMQQQMQQQHHQQPMGPQGAGYPGQPMPGNQFQQQYPPQQMGGGGGYGGKGMQQQWNQYGGGQPWEPQGYGGGGQQQWGGYNQWGGQGGMGY